MSDLQNTIPSFEELAKQHDTANGKIPSFEDLEKWHGDGEVKKKEGGGAVGGAGLNASISGGLSGGVGTGINEGYHKAVLADVITQKPISKNETPFDQTKEEAMTGATKRLNDIMYGEGSDWKDPIKAAENGIVKSNNIKEASDNLGVKTIIENSIMPNGYEAKKTLAGTLLGQMGDDNLTAKALREKSDKYDRTVSALRDIKTDVDLNGANEEFLKYNYGSQINNAAVKAYAANHPDFRKDLKRIGVDINDQFLADRIPSGKLGAIKTEFFNDPNVSAYLEKENPNLSPAFRVAEENHLTDDVDYGINVVANKVSQGVEKSGYNKIGISPLINFHDEGDEEMNDMVAKEVLSPQELKIWNDHIKNNQSKYMDEPSFMEGVATGIKNVGGSIAKLVSEPFTSEKQSVLNQWHKEASNVSADPEGVTKFLRDTGSVIGFLMTVGATQGVTGLSSVNALTLATTGDIIQESREKYRGEPIKAALSGMLNVALYRALGKDMFPVEKAKKAFTSVRSQIDEVVENLTNGKITQDAARKQVSTTIGKAIDFAGGTITQDAKIAAELTGLQLVNRIFDKVGMDKETFKKYHADGEIAEGFGHNFLSNLVVAGLGKYGQMKNANNAVSESIYEAASRPNEYKRQVDNNLNLSFADANEIKENIDFASGVLKQLNGLSPKNQKRYLFEAMQERAKENLTAETGEPTLDKKHKDEVKEHQEVKERILGGEDHETIVTESDQKRIDKQQKANEEIKSLTKQKELDNKSFDLKVKDLDGRNPDDNIKKQKIEQQRQDKNSDYDKKIQSIKDEFPEANHEETQLEQPKEQSDIDKERADKLFKQKLTLGQKYPKGVKVEDPVTGKKISVKSARGTFEKRHYALEKLINCL